jgi:hypothetical protein
LSPASSLAVIALEPASLSLLNRHHRLRLDRQRIGEVDEYARIAELPIREILPLPPFADLPRCGQVPARSLDQKAPEPPWDDRLARLFAATEAFARHLQQDQPRRQLDAVLVQGPEAEEKQSATGR